MPIAAAIAGAAVLGAGVSISASNKASKTAKKTAAANNALEKQIYDQNAATLSPYVAQGSLATPIINGALGLGDSAAAERALGTFKASTGYETRLAEGQRGVNAALGASSLRDSGAAVKAALKFNQNFASNEFGNFLGALQGQQALGLQAAGAQTNLGQNYANSVSNNNNVSAGIQAQAALSNATTINSALGSVVSAYGLSQGGLGTSYRAPALGGGGGGALGFNPQSFINQYGIGSF